MKIREILEAFGMHRNPDEVIANLSGKIPPMAVLKAGRIRRLRLRMLDSGYKEMRRRGLRSGWLRNPL